MREEPFKKKDLRIGSFLIGTYRKHARKIWIILLLLIFLAATNAVLPRLSAQIIDEGLVRGDTGKVVQLALIILLLSVSVSLLYIAIEFFRLKVYNDVQTDLKKKVLNKLLHVDYSYFNKRSAPEVYQQFEEDITAIAGCFSSEILMEISQIVVSLFLVPALVSISWKLSLIMLAAIPLELLKTVFFSRMGYRISKKKLEAKTRYSAWMADVISGNNTIRNFGLASHFYDLFRIRQREVADTQVQQGMVLETMIRLDAFLIDLLTFIIYVIGGYLIAGSELSLGYFIAFEGFSLNMLSLGGKILGITVGYASLKPSVERFLTFMDEKDETSGIEMPPVDFRELRTEQVFFAYDPGSELIRGVSLEIHRGDRIAIWGQNGSGKTTLIKLLLRTINPVDGMICLNEKNIQKIAIEPYRQLFAVATQNPFLFCDSIRNNVALYSDEISDEQIMEALDQVGLGTLAEEKGLDYIVGQNGCELSGGQRQRLSLARTLVSIAPIVILDEPEVSLDQGFEQQFGDLLDQQYRERTLIIITHRPELMHKMDQAYLLKDGQLLPWTEETEVGE